MDDSTYTIQELTDLTGLSRRTIHFYKGQGILAPPMGAGLGARYGEEHLLRLRLVPLLRRQGLRLDAIRERLVGMSLAEMQRSLAAAPSAVEPVPGLPAPAPRPAQTFAHYPLPAGITLVAPAHLKPAERQKLSALLDAAARIFGRSIPIRLNQDSLETRNNSPQRRQGRQEDDSETKD